MHLLLADRTQFSVHTSVAPPVGQPGRTTTRAVPIPKVEGSQELKLMVAEKGSDRASRIHCFDLKSTDKVDNVKSFLSSVHIVAQEPKALIATGPVTAASELMSAQLLSERLQVAVHVRDRESA